MPTVSPKREITIYQGECFSESGILPREANAKPFLCFFYSRKEAHSDQWISEEESEASQKGKGESSGKKKGL